MPDYLHTHYNFLILERKEKIMYPFSLVVYESDLGKLEKFYLLTILESFDKPIDTNQILEHIKTIIDKLYDSPKYKKYKSMKSTNISNDSMAIDYAKYQCWDDGNLTDEGRELFFQFKKELIDKIYDELSDELKSLKLTVVEDDDFMICLKKEKKQFLPNRKMNKAISESIVLTNQEKEYLLILMEESSAKLSKEDKARLDSFMTRYDARIDKDGNGSILLNNRRATVRPAKDRKVIASGLDEKISLDLTKLCKIPKDEQIDAVMWHEEGHRRLHNLHPNSQIADRKRMNTQIRAKVAGDIINTSRTGDPVQDASISNDIYNKRVKGINDSGANEELVAKRLAFRDGMKKYADLGTYVTVNELEADQFSANKVGKDAVISALKSMDKLDDVYGEIDAEREIKQEKKTKKFQKLPNKKAKEKFVSDIREKHKKYAKKIHKMHEKETKIRADALNDRSVDDGIRKSLSD